MTFSEITYHPDRQQFTLEVERKIAKIDETQRSGKLYLTHSEVPYDLRGQGISKVFVEKTFEQLAKEGYTAVAVCSYIRAVTKRSDHWNTIIQ